MKRIWSPWRMEYILADKRGSCVFCDKPREERDADNLILHHGEHCYVIMNRFPYTNGHLMVSPYAHVHRPGDLPVAALTEMMLLTNLCLEVLGQAMRPDGYNIGMNLGASAGAGIKDHIHMHIVPRWTGDTNFMAVFCETRVVSEALSETYGKLKPLFERPAS